MGGNHSIKGYELHERIGSGGFGVVHRAYQSTVGREVAVKIILPHYANHPNFIRRFETEAQIVARLEHMNIVPLYDYWRDPDGAYLVMRWLRGGSLSDAIADGPFTVQKAARLFEQMASALSLAHRQDVIHRDLKPSNILLDEDGNAYLTDFGIAKDLTVHEQNTQSGDVIGSPGYLAPEQARSETVSPRTDIYSLGVMLYEVLAGEHPFPNLSAVERLYKHLNDPLPLLTSLDEDVQDTINGIIQKATAKNPAHRYADALELASALGELTSRQETTSPESIVESLTRREQEILQLIIEGHSNREIAQALFVALSTVKWYVNQIYKKLNVRNRVQAIIRARELNLIFTDVTQDETSEEQTFFALPEAVNPYKGLRAFQTADERDFFGREKISQKLINRMATPEDNVRFLAIVGPSGSGKSSLVKAGLIPALWRGELPGSENWFVADMIPGSHPVDELEIALMKLAADQSSSIGDILNKSERGLIKVAQLILPDNGSELVIVIDQFEEVFTLAGNEALRIQFLDLIHAAVTDPRSRVRIVITLRADFYDRPLHYPMLGELVRNRMETLLPLSADELERAIVQPVRKIGVKFEDGLVAHIIDEVLYQPGALPLLQYALTELFEQRRGRLLTREAYQTIGGTVGALAKRAGDLYHEQDEIGQSLIQQMFLRLVTLGEGVEDTRRRVNRSELISLSDNEDLMDDIIDVFADYRLLSLDNDPTTREPTVEVAHEAILREWERLRDWLNESRDDIKMQRLLSQAADAWQQNNCDVSYLLRGSRLERFETWATQTDVALTSLELHYVSASSAEREQQQAAVQAQQERETRLEQHARTVLRTLAVVFAVAAVVAGGLALFALNARNAETQARQEAETARDEAGSIALAAAANSAHLLNNPEQAIALAMAANSITGTPPAYAQSVLYDVAFTPASRRTFTFTENPPERLMLSPDGQQVLMFYRDDEWSVVYWDLTTKQTVARWTSEFLGENRLCQLMFAPDGEIGYVAVSNPATASGFIVEFDVVTGQELKRFIPPEDIPCEMALDPDAQMLVSESITRQEDGRVIVSAVNRWEVASGQLTRHVPLALGDLPIDASELMCSRLTTDGEKLVSTYSTGMIALWNANTGELLGTYQEPGDHAVHVCAFVTPAGIVAASLDLVTYITTIALWDEATGERLKEVVWNTRLDRGGALSPDDRTLALALGSGQITLLDLDTWQTTALYGHNPHVTGLFFTPDSQSLLSSASDGTIRLWNLKNGAEIRRIEGPESFLGAFEISPDGRTVAAQEYFDTAEGQLGLWDLETGALIRPLAYNQNGMQTVAFSPDGASIVSASLPIYDCPGQGATLHLTDVATGEMIWEATKEEGLIYGGAVFGQDGDTILTVDWRCENFVTVWDAATGDKIDEWHGHEDSIRAISASPDGKWIATGSNDQTAILWDATTGNVIHTLPHDSYVAAVAFSPDSQFLLTSGTTLRLWDVATGRELRQFTGHSSVVFFMDFSPDSRYVVSSSASDSNIFVWDVRTSEAVRNFHLPLISMLGSAVAFSPDGQSIYFTGENNIIHQIDLMLEPGELMNWIRENRYVRDLTAGECQLYGVEAYCAQQ
ncbi:MAG: protein kinase [Chloroflexi bacterium]|nr:protein kinase [Chloroflexota bacterium]